MLKMPNPLLQPRPLAGAAERHVRPHMTRRSRLAFANLMVACGFATPLLSSCGTTSQVPYGQPRSSVRSLASMDLINQEVKTSGGFHFTFKRADVDRFGPPRSEAVETYLKAHPHLMPPQCLNGSLYVRGGDTENGWGWAIFRCRAES
jgi:hypothetical protein